MIITGNGNHEISLSNKFRDTGTTIVYISGALGAATATIEYKDSAGNYVSFTDGAVVIDDQYKIEHGLDTTIYVTVTGADGSTNIVVDAKSL